MSVNIVNIKSPVILFTFSICVCMYYVRTYVCMYACMHACMHVSVGSMENRIFLFTKHLLQTLK